MISTKVHKIWALVFGLGVLSAGCGSRAPTIVVTGSSTIAPLMGEIAARFEAANPGVRIDVQTGGSGRGVKDARSGQADLGMVSRSLRESERDLTAFPIARDGISLIVHRDNPVAELDRAQVVAMYRGEVEDWAKVGGRPGPVTVVHKAEGRSTLELFLAYYGLTNPEVKPDLVIGDNLQGVKSVAGNPGAIGYVSIGTALHDAASGVPIRLLPLDGVVPSLEAVASGRYPLARDLVLATRGEPRAEVRALIEFARSEAVHDLVRGQAFVPFPTRP